MAWQCLPNPHYLGLGWLPSPSSLGLVCLRNPSYLGSDLLQSPSSLGLTCLPDLSYLRSDMFGLLQCLSSLDLTCLPDPSYIGLGWLPSPRTCQTHISLDLDDCQVQVLWISHSPYQRYLRFMRPILFKKTFYK